MTAILVQDLSFSAQEHFWSPKRSILNNVSLSVEAGEIFGFLGPNGAGKTTTIKMMLGLATPDSGTCHLFGAPPAEPRSRRGLGYMPERVYFPEHLNAKELVSHHAVLAGCSAGGLDAKVSQALEKVGLLSRANDRLSTYSKGMLQRAGLAQAIVAEPKLVILDEPMSGLDPIGRRDIRNILLNLASTGVTVFFSTHILADAEVLCDRVAIIQDGHVQTSGTLQSLLSQDDAGAEVHISLSEALPPHIKVTSTLLMGEGQLLQTLRRDDTENLQRWVIEHGGTILSLNPKQRHLEEYFETEHTDA